MKYEISIEDYSKKGLSIAIRDENKKLVELNNARFSSLKKKLSANIDPEKDFMLFKKVNRLEIKEIEAAIKKANSGVIDVS